MNPVRCANGHFFDLDKFAFCPHCKAFSKEGTPAGKNAFEAPKRVSLFEKRKHGTEEKKVPDQNVRPANGMNGNGTSVNRRQSGNRFDDGQTDKTVGLMNGDALTARMTPFYSGVQRPNEEKTAYLNIPLKKPDNIGAVREKKDEVFPEGPPKETVETGNPGSSEASAEPFAEEPVPLKEAIRSAVNGSEGKTLGFFNAGREDIESEPVVGWIVCVKGKHFGESFCIAAGRNSVGRNQNNKICLSKDNTVSGDKHLWIVYEPKKKEFFVQPGESSGLTYLNDESVFETKRLKKADMIDIGNGKYTFVPLCGDDFSWENYLDR